MFSVVLFPFAPGDAPSLLLAVVQTTLLFILYLCLPIKPCSPTVIHTEGRKVPGVPTPVIAESRSHGIRAGCFVFLGNDF